MPEPAQPVAGPAASPSDCHRRPLLCLPTPHRRPWPWAEQQPHRGRTGSTDADAGHRPGSFVLSAAAGEPELLQHGGEPCAPQPRTAPSPPCFQPRPASLSSCSAAASPARSRARLELDPLAAAVALLFLMESLLENNSRRLGGGGALGELPTRRSALPPPPPSMEDRWWRRCMTRPSPHR